MHSDAVCFPVLSSSIGRPQAGARRLAFAPLRLCVVLLCDLCGLCVQTLAGLMTYEQATSAISQQFSGARLEAGTPLVVSVPVADWRAFAQFAKDTLGCRFFNFLSAVDWKELGLEVVARLDNLDARVALMVKTRLAPGASVCDSIVPVYRGADWMERECFDMFGIRFDGHPNMSRILLTPDWEGHPLLKSYAVDTPHPPYR